MSETEPVGESLELHAAIANAAAPNTAPHKSRRRCIRNELQEAGVMSLPGGGAIS